MAITTTYSYPVLQADYDAGVRVYVCEFCHNSIKSDGVISETIECAGCLPDENDVLKVMEPATYNSGTEAFEWTKVTWL